MANSECREALSGYPDDYLAPSLFVKRRCGGRITVLHGNGVSEGRAKGRFSSAFSWRSDIRDEGNLRGISGVEVLSRYDMDELIESVGCE